MPPRHAYWTILVDDQATAFRAHDPEELLATLNRLKEKHPSAVMKWFERGKLWDSRDAAREQGFGQSERRWEGPRPDPTEPPRRDKSWRPGGEHRDPRQKYKDAKKAKWNRLKENIRARSDRARSPAPARPDPESFSPPHGDRLRAQIGGAGRDRRPDRDGPPPGPHRDTLRPQPSARKPAGNAGRRAPWKGASSANRATSSGGRDTRPRSEGAWRGRDRDDRSRETRPRDDRPRGDRSWQDRPSKDRPWNNRPGGSRSRGDRPPGDHRASDRPRGDRPPDRSGPGPRRDDQRGYGAKAGGFGAKKPWGSKAGGFGAKRPWGTKPRGAKPAGGGRSKGSGKAFGRRGPRKPRDDE